MEDDDRLYLIKMLLGTLIAIVLIASVSMYEIKKLEMACEKPLSIGEKK